MIDLSPRFLIVLNADPGNDEGTAAPEPMTKGENNADALFQNTIPAAGW